MSINNNKIYVESKKKISKMQEKNPSFTSNLAQKRNKFIITVYIIIQAE